MIIKRRILILFSLFISIIIVSCGLGNSSSTTKSSWKERDNSRDAYEISIDMLYASQGSTIKMCGYSNASVIKSGTTYTVKGYFDTQSVYSSKMVRMDYTIVVEQTSATKFIQKSATVSNARFL